MKELLKSIKRGIGYFFTPFIWAIIMVIQMTICLIMFIIELLRGFIMFITGRNIFKELPEDIQLAELKSDKSEVKTTAETNVPPVQNNTNQGGIDNDFDL